MISPRTHVTTISFFFIVSFLIYFLVTDLLSLSPGFAKCASIFITIPLMSYSKLLVLFSCNLFLIYFCHFLISHFYVAHSSFSHECSFQLPRTWFIVQFIIGISFIFIIIIFFFRFAFCMNTEVRRFSTPATFTRLRCSDCQLFFLINAPAVYFILFWIGGMGMADLTCHHFHKILIRNQTFQLLRIKLKDETLMQWNQWYAGSIFAMKTVNYTRVKCFITELECSRVITLDRRLPSSDKFCSH